MGATLTDAADALAAFTFTAPDPLGLLPGDLPGGDLGYALALPALPDTEYDVPEWSTAGDDEWEAKVGVPSFARYDDLLRQIDEKMAPLSTLFRGAQNTTADSMRKQHRAWVGSVLLTEGKATDKTSATALEAAANADPRHLRYAAAIRRLEDTYHALWADKATVERRLAERDHRINTFRGELRNTR